jgi:acyl phosphate:glycerol-3-phosphate acyltransferase
MILILLAILAYFLGSIPFGLIVSRKQGVDIMNVGSGNIGATNVVRALGPKLGLVVFALDILKGAIPAILTKALVTQPMLGIDVQTWSFIFGVVAMLGHMFSPWLGFKGGKGIATGLGATLGSIPITGLSSILVVLVVTGITRYVSLGSMVATIAIIPVSVFIAKDSRQVLPILIVMAVFILYKHRANIQRLKAGTESKFNFKKHENLDKIKPQDQKED